MLLLFSLENIDSFLSMAEKQRIILHEMESIRIEQEDAEYIPMKLNFYFGQAISMYKSVSTVKSAGCVS